MFFSLAVIKLGRWRDGEWKEESIVMRKKKELQSDIHEVYILAL